MARRLRLNHSDTLTVEQAFQEFISHSKAKSLRDVTIKVYIKNYNYLTNYLGDTNVPPDTIKRTLVITQSINTIGFNFIKFK